MNLEPIVIIGAGRSGTKFLRDLLAESQIACKIPFDVGYVWRTGNETFPNDAFTPDMVARADAAYIRRMLYKLATPKRSAHARILIEKSVPNSLRPAFVRVILPDAKFIHIVRDGRAVVESALRVWNDVPGARYFLQKLHYVPWRNYKHGLWYLKETARRLLGARRTAAMWGPRYPGMENDVRDIPLELVCARQWRYCVAISSDQFEDFPSSRVLHVRYEDLVSNAETVVDVCRFIGVDDPTPILHKYHSIVRPSDADKWKASLSGDVLRSISGEIAATLAKHNYVV